ncbi:Uncharacterised protein [Amycolatopsis camponoti]|uniref:Uncharacterized protein n=1 Tax=Amycolatopsis camponoti TaxID=2606593 RepID=A0A6I8LQU3_9PSEU|nr:Uncharacterised protein [Amycolatopsis camponoti]
MDRPRHRRSGQSGSTRPGRLRRRVLTTNSVLGAVGRHHDTKLYGLWFEVVAVQRRSPPRSGIIAVSSLPDQPWGHRSAAMAWATDLRAQAMC